jgi:hypothetical protein
MTVGRFFRLLDDEDDSAKWFGYCTGIVVVFVAAVSMLFLLILNGK